MILIGHQAQMFSLFPCYTTLRASVNFYCYIFMYISDALAIGNEFYRTHINAAYSVNKIQCYSWASCVCVYNVQISFLVFLGHCGYIATVFLSDRASPCFDTHSRMYSPSAGCEQGIKPWSTDLWQCCNHFTGPLQLTRVGLLACLDSGYLCTFCVYSPNFTLKGRY